MYLALFIFVMLTLASLLCVGLCWMIDSLGIFGLWFENVVGASLIFFFISAAALIFMGLFIICYTAYINEVI